MTDGLVERAEQKLMRRSEHDQAPSGAKTCRHPPQLGAIVGDVFEDVDVERAVEPIPVGNVGCRTAHNAKRETGVGETPRKTSSELDVRLQARPVARTVGERHRIRSDTRTNLQNTPAKVRLDLPRPVTLPVRREREQVELGSDIRVGRVSRVVRSHRQNSGNPESAESLANLFAP